MNAVTYEFLVEPFAMGTDKECAAKPLEEAAEAFGEWQLCTSEYKNERLAHTRFDVMYECCDVIQAACNLMSRMGATPDDVERVMGAVHRNNERRGRYVQAEEG